MERMKDYKYLSFAGAFVKDEEIWFSSSSFNGLFKRNQKNRKTEFVGRFPEVLFWQNGLHQKVCNYGEKLFFFPDFLSGVHSYDMRNGKFEFYPIIFKEFQEGIVRGIDIVVKEEKVWIFFAYSIHPVLTFDMKTKTYEKCFFVSDELHEIAKNGKRPLFWSRFTKYKSDIFGVAYGTSKIVKIDLDEKKTEVYDLEISDCHLSSVTFDGSLFWALDVRKNEVIEYGVLEGVRNIYSTSNKEKLEENQFSDILYYNKQIFLIPNYADEICCINKEKKEIKEGVSLLQKKRFTDLRKEWRRFFSAEVIDDQLFLFPVNNREMLVVNMHTMFARGEEIILPEDWTEEYYKDEIENKRNLNLFLGKEPLEQKDGLLSLEGYLSFLSKMDIDTDIGQDEKVQVENGKKIFDYIMGEVRE